MSLIEITVESGPGVRWLVYTAAIREPMLGETRHDVMRWHSRAYIANTAGNNRVFLEDPHQARSLASAHLRARNQCRRFYRKNTTR